ncbi:MAG: DUF924 family protein [Alphaproteobacteria bacterium]
MADPTEILDFWFSPAVEKNWFQTPPELDAEITKRFGATHETAARGELAGWEDSAEGALALLILLDQFPRNMFRGSPRAFASDELARSVAGRAIERGHDLKTAIERRVFFYLPLEHSEAIGDQNRCCELAAERCDIGDYLAYAESHRAVIERFGRFPHRNAPLGRQSTQEEIDYLESGEARF